MTTEKRNARTDGTDSTSSVGQDKGAYGAGGDMTTKDGGPAFPLPVSDDGEAFVTTAHYNGTGGWLGMNRYLLAATHWMPLPEPPTC